MPEQKQQDSGLTWGKALRGIVWIGGIVVAAYGIGMGITEGLQAISPELFESDGTPTNSAPFLIKTASLFGASMVGMTQWIGGIVSYPFEQLIDLINGEAPAPKATALVTQLDEAIPLGKHDDLIEAGAAAVGGTALAMAASGGKKERQNLGPHTQREIARDARRAELKEQLTQMHNV